MVGTALCKLCCQSKTVPGSGLSFGNGSNEGLHTSCHNFLEPHLLHKNLDVRQIGFNPCCQWDKVAASAKVIKHLC